MTPTSAPWKETVWSQTVARCGFWAVQLALAFVLITGISGFAQGQDASTAAEAALPGLPIDSVNPANPDNSINSANPVNPADSTEETVSPAEAKAAKGAETARQERIAHLQRFDDKSTPWLNLFFIWIGFIFCTGLLAKGIVAFSDQRAGLWTVMFSGTIGTCANIGIQLYLFTEKDMKPISVSGFVLSFLVAFFVMLIYVKCAQISKPEK